jgi:hypothetical protein
MRKSLAAITAIVALAAASSVSAGVGFPPYTTPTVPPSFCALLVATGHTPPVLAFFGCPA